MNRAQIAEFIKKNPAFFLSTTDGRKPHVRGMMLVHADDQGIVFHTWKHKDVYRQLVNNNQVELCFYNPRDYAQLRIAGKTEMVEDEQLKENIINKFRFLKREAAERGLENMAVFRLARGKATFWSMATIFEEQRWFNF